MMFTDKSLPCVSCAESFVFTAGEQEFFSLKGLSNEPKRCANCRLVMRLQRNGQKLDALHDVQCEDCGASTKVPFKPTGRKPVYCNVCLKTRAPLAV